MESREEDVQGEEEEAEEEEEGEEEEEEEEATVSPYDLHLFASILCC